MPRVTCTGQFYTHINSKFVFVESHFDPKYVSPRSTCSKPKNISTAIDINQSALPLDPELLKRCHAIEKHMLRGTLAPEYRTTVLSTGARVKLTAFESMTNPVNDTRYKCANCTRFFFSKGSSFYRGCEVCSNDCAWSFTQRQVDQQAEQYTYQTYY
jgi:hypothetical protein